MRTLKERMKKSLGVGRRIGPRVELEPKLLASRLLLGSLREADFDLMVHEVLQEELT